MTEATTATTMCVCGHLREAHLHLRRGTDCAICREPACTRFRLRSSPLQRALRALRPQH